jgi:peptidoglycan L-alanyl-D-glutamate endopeptidase CwlK
MTIRLNPKLLTLDPAVRPHHVARIQACYRRGVPVRFVSGRRSVEEQAMLYEKGRALIDGHWTVIDPEKVVTNAIVGWHNFGLAGDVALLVDGKTLTWKDADRDGDGIEDWLEVAKATEECGFFDAARGEIGFYWRGKLIDPPHAERHRGLTLGTAVDRYRHGFDVVTGQKIS